MKKDDFELLIHCTTHNSNFESFENFGQGALFTPAQIGVRPIFENGVIRAGVKKGPAEKGPIRY